MIITIISKIYKHFEEGNMVESGWSHRQTTLARVVLSGEVLLDPISKK